MLVYQGIGFWFKVLCSLFSLPMPLTLVECKIINVANPMMEPYPFYQIRTMMLTGVPTMLVVSPCIPY